MGGTSNLPFTQGAMAKRSDRGKLFCLRCLLGNDFALTDIDRVAVGDRATTATTPGYHAHWQRVAPAMNRLRWALDTDVRLPRLNHPHSRIERESYSALPQINPPPMGLRPAPMSTFT